MLDRSKNFGVVVLKIEVLKGRNARAAKMKRGTGASESKESTKADKPFAASRQLLRRTDHASKTSETKRPAGLSPLGLVPAQATAGLSHRPVDARKRLLATRDNILLVGKQASRSQDFAHRIAAPCFHSSVGDGLEFAVSLIHIRSRLAA